MYKIYCDIADLLHFTFYLNPTSFTVEKKKIITETRSWNKLADTKQENPRKLIAECPPNFHTCFKCLLDTKRYQTILMSYRRTKHTDVSVVFSSLSSSDDQTQSPASVRWRRPLVPGTLLVFFSLKKKKRIILLLHNSGFLWNKIAYSGRN